MSLFTAGDTLKVIVIGDDGIARASVVKRDATMAGNKYIITQKDVFLQRVKKFDLFWIDQPTILFRQNSIHAVNPDGEESYPTPQETADVIENSAMHLFTIFGKETNIMMIILLILAGVGAGSGCVAAYYGYQHDAALKDIHADIASVQGYVSNLSYVSPQPVEQVTPVVIQKPTVKPTVVVTTSPTPYPVQTLPALGR